MAEIRRVATTLLALAVSVLSPGLARADSAPIRIGLISDMSSVYADNTGQGSIDAATLAIEDVGGRVAGRPVLLQFADHQNKADLGIQIAQRWFDVDGVDALFDITNTTVARGLIPIVEKRNKFMQIGAPTLSFSQQDCSANAVQWQADIHTLVYGVSRFLTQSGAKSWFYLAVDYSYGADLQRSSEQVVKSYGGQVAGSVRHPLNTPDFSSFLLAAQTAKPDTLALANAGADTLNAVKQAGEFGLLASMKLALLNGAINNIEGLGLAAAQGLYVDEPFYWDMNDKTRAFATRFMAKRGKMPNYHQAGTYSAVLAYLRTLNGMLASGGAMPDGASIVAKMKTMPTEDDVYGKGYVRADGRHVHDSYLFQVKKPGESSGRWDIYRLVETFRGDESMLPLSDKCKLVTK